MSAKGIPLSRFALLLSFVPDVQRIVRDRTGLAGAFDLDIEFAPVGSADAPDLPPITTALKEQLGLELRPATGSVSVIVIDSVEPPTPDYPAPTVSWSAFGLRGGNSRTWHSPARPSFALAR